MFDPRRPQDFSLTPSQLYGELKEYVIGQDDACRLLARAACAHYASLGPSVIPRSYEPLTRLSHNVLFSGNSGMGKTTLVKALARTLNVPYLFVDASALTSEGYVGMSVGDIFEQLHERSQSLAHAQTGIIVLDEIDKKAYSSELSGDRDISGADVIHQLLVALEGGKYKIDPGGSEPYVDIKTDSMLFIGIGAFEGIEEIAHKRQGKGRIGFSGQGDSGNILDSLSDEDYIKFGFSRQFIARFPHLGHLRDLDVEDLEQIARLEMHPPRVSFEDGMAHYDVGVNFEDDVYRAWAEQAEQLGSGSRGLTRIMERSFGPLRDRVEVFSGRVIPLHASCVNDPENYARDLAGRVDELAAFDVDGESGQRSYEFVSSLLQGFGVTRDNLLDACVDYLMRMRGRVLACEMPGKIQALRYVVNEYVDEVSRAQKTHIEVTDFAVDYLVADLLSDGIEPYAAHEHLSGRLEPLLDHELMQGIERFRLTGRNVGDLASAIANTPLK